jgi:hypothetical protein
MSTIFFIKELIYSLMLLNIKDIYIESIHKSFDMVSLDFFKEIKKMSFLELLLPSAGTTMGTKSVVTTICSIIYYVAW